MEHQQNKENTHETQFHPLQKPLMLVTYAIMFAGILIAGSIVATVLVPAPFLQKSTIAGNTLDGKSGVPAQIKNQGDNTGGDKDATIAIGDDPVLGNKNQAKVAIVEFSDYECPFCKKFHAEARKEIVKQYVDTGKAVLVFKDFPLSFHEPAASKESAAANCVKKLSGDDAYFTFSESLYKNTGTNGRGMSDDTMRILAQNAGVSLDAYTTCVKESDFKDEIAKDVAEGEAFGISGTPAFVIGTLSPDGSIQNTEKIVGAQPFEAFKKIIEKKL